MKNEKKKKDEQTEKLIEHWLLGFLGFVIPPLVSGANLMVSGGNGTTSPHDDMRSSVWCHLSSLRKALSECSRVFQP